MTSETLEYLRAGSSQWNAWRETQPTISLRDWDFEKTHGRGPSDLPLEFEGYDFSGLDLHGISARNLIFSNCLFDDCPLNFADLCFSHFLRCSFVGVSMRVTKIGSSVFESCVFQDADLGYCSAKDTKFSRSRIIDSSFAHMSLVNADFTGAELSNVCVYGTSAWDLRLDGSTQRDIVITEPNKGSITVDNLELAQFVHLLIRNARIRDAIDTITSKVVLLLGRFTPPRKHVLDRLKTLLSSRNYVPIVFDFEGPRNRDITETVRILASLSRFVVVDLTDPNSVPHELSLVVPSLPSVPLQPIIEVGAAPFGMFDHYTRFPWVMAVREYRSEDVERLAEEIVEACEERLAAGS